ncbi:SufE family protein [Nesterenkonia sandarakina]|uniref:Cysteine desulfuration protein SufE n=1 Tax=Nesterenkonia sandarakina TaxID=272918 RepID=A0A2T0YBX0_9MICC|nr:SufE family protein [Nesterenkonia sandarakina]PRZ12113.1 cysteine desulfuration protein SufE [Nesterenkonia sandarakina]
MTTGTPLARIFEEFQSVGEQQRLMLLLDYAKRLPELPGAYRDSLQDMDEVVECQSPLFLATDFDDAAEVAHIYFAAPPEAPTTRGFASILQHGLSGQSYEAILGVKADVGSHLGLARVITPLRLRAVNAMVGRISRSVRDHVG